MTEDIKTAFVSLNVSLSSELVQKFRGTTKTLGVTQAELMTKILEQHFNPEVSVIPTKPIRQWQD